MSFGRLSKWNAEFYDLPVSGSTVLSYQSGISIQNQTTDRENGKMDRIDAEANEILNRELKEKWQEKKYDDFAVNPNDYGFTNEYLGITT